MRRARSEDNSKGPPNGASSVELSGAGQRQQPAMGSQGEGSRQQPSQMGQTQGSHSQPGGSDTDAHAHAQDTPVDSWPSRESFAKDVVPLPPPRRIWTGSETDGKKKSH